MSSRQVRVGTRLISCLNKQHTIYMSLLHKNHGTRRARELGLVDPPASSSQCPRPQEPLVSYKDTQSKPRYKTSLVPPQDWSNRSRQSGQPCLCGRVPQYSRPRGHPLSAVFVRCHGPPVVCLYLAYTIRIDTQRQPSRLCLVCPLAIVPDLFWCWAIGRKGRCMSKNRSKRQKIRSFTALPLLRPLVYAPRPSTVFPIQNHRHSQPSPTQH